MKLLKDFNSGLPQFRIIAHPLSRPDDGRTILAKPPSHLACGNR
jgi:hypothetical protein